MQCASASSSISRLRVRAMVDSSYQLRRLESDESSPHRARKVTLGRPTSTSATRRSMSCSRPAAAALPDGRPVGCVSRLACVGSDSLFQSVVSSGVGHTVTLLHAVRGPAHPEMDIAVPVTLRRTISRGADARSDFNTIGNSPKRRMHAPARTRIVTLPLRSPRVGSVRFCQVCGSGAWEMVCIDFIIISKLHHLNHNWWWRQ